VTWAALTTSAEITKSVHAPTASLAKAKRVSGHRLRSLLLSGLGGSRQPFGTPTMTGEAIEPTCPKLVQPVPTERIRVG